MGPSENDKDFVLSSGYRGSETLEPREEISYASGSNISGGPSFRHIYIAVGGFLVLIVLAVVIIARTYSLAEKSQLLALQSRLEQLESRLGSMQGEGAASQAGGSGNQLILLTERLDQLEANLTSRINTMSSQLDKTVLKPAMEGTKKAEAVKAAPASKEEAAAKHYTVKRGDTLYRISRRYDLSVEQLRRYNELDPKASIYPGQKLNLTPPK